MGKSVIELEMIGRIRAVRLRRDRIIIVQDSEIRLYTFSDIPVELCKFPTWTNPSGLCALSPATDRSLMAFPSQKGAGVMELIDVVSGCEERKQSVQIKAHNHLLQAMSFNVQGRLLSIPYYCDIV